MHRQQAVKSPHNTHNNREKLENSRSACDAKKNQFAHNMPPRCSDDHMQLFNSTVTTLGKAADIKFTFSGKIIPSDHM
jgi:hypothetical protein